MKVRDKISIGWLDPGQVEWGTRLAANPGILYAVWRPLDLLAGTIAALLGDPQRVLTLARDQAAAARLATARTPPTGPETETHR